MVAGVLRVGAVLAALSLGACASVPFMTASEDAAPARPQCAPYRATIYFERDSASLPPASTPILREVMDKIAACRAEGGDLKRIVVESHADQPASDSAAKADVRARALVVRQALIEVGAPRRAVQISNAAPRETEVMQRRTTIAVEMK